MDANKIRVLFNNQPKDLVIPLQQEWDFYGQQQAIEQYESTIIEKILNQGDDYEVTRFDHQLYDVTKSSLNYDFYLNNPISGATSTWQNSYLARFTADQVYYYSPAFTKSFWKIDFYMKF